MRRADHHTGTLGDTPRPRQRAVLDPTQSRWQIAASSLFHRRCSSLWRGRFWGQSMNIAVVGGGAFGMMAAIRLAEMGEAVSLFERLPGLMEGVSSNANGCIGDITIRATRRPRANASMDTESSSRNSRVRY